MEKSIFSVLQQPYTGLGVGGSTKVGWKQDSDCAQSQIYSDKTFPWKQQGREVLTQACKRPQIEMNKMQLCPVAKSLLGLFHFVSLAIFAWQLYNLGSSNIKIHLFKWLAVFWRWESSTADQRLQLLLQKRWMKFLKNWQVYFSNCIFFQFFCQQLHEIKWCNSPYPLPLASANLLLAITEGSKALNRQEADEQSCKCSPSNAAQPACNHWPL